MVTRTAIYTKAEGALAQNEDWWVLVVDRESGKQSVEHEWSHTNGYGPGQNSGTTTATVDEFLASDAPEAAKDRLRTMIGIGV